jgi:hypothetical protein
MMPIISQSSNRAAKVLRTIAIAIISIWAISNLFFGLLSDVTKGIGLFNSDIRERIYGRQWEGT